MGVPNRGRAAQRGWGWSAWVAAVCIAACTSTPAQARAQEQGSPSGPQWVLDDAVLSAQAPGQADGALVLGSALAAVSVANFAVAFGIYRGYQDEIDAIHEVSATPGGDVARYTQLRSDIEASERSAWIFTGIGAGFAVASGLVWIGRALGWGEGPSSDAGAEGARGAAPDVGFVMGDGGWAVTGEVRF